MTDNSQVVVVVLGVVTVVINSVVGERVDVDVDADADVDRRQETKCVWLATLVIFSRQLQEKKLPSCLPGCQVARFKSGLPHVARYYELRSS